MTTSVTKGWLRDLEADRWPSLAEVRRQSGEPVDGWSLTWAVLDRTASIWSSVACGNSVLGSDADTMADVEQWAVALLDGRDPVIAAMDLAGRLVARVHADCHRPGLRQRAGLQDSAWVLAGIVDQLRVEARSRLRPVPPPIEARAVAAAGGVVVR